MHVGNVERIDNRIFVTGLPRSGTTFVGKVLSLPLSVDYVHEPFNPSCGIGGLTQRYIYLRDGLDRPDARLYHAAISAMFRYDVRFKTGLYTRDRLLKRATKRVIGSRGQIHLILAKLNPWHNTILIKDPTAPFLTEFLARHFQVKPVIMIRHPLSLIPSWQRLGFNAEFHFLCEQDALVEDHLADQLPVLTRPYADPVEGIALFWRVMHEIILQQAQGKSGWQIVTHEALSAQPEAEFRQLYQQLGLPWSRRIESRIRKLTNAANPAEARAAKAHDFHRDSAAIFGLRRQALTRDQRRKVYEIVAEVAAPYYDRASFALD